MPALERVPELQVLYVGIHASASQIDIQRNALIGETAIEAETEDGVIVERITNGPDRQSVVEFRRVLFRSLLLSNTSARCQRSDNIHVGELCPPWKGYRSSRFCT